LTPELPPKGEFWARLPKLNSARTNKTQRTGILVRLWSQRYPPMLINSAENPRGMG